MLRALIAVQTELAAAALELQGVLDLIVARSAELTGADGAVVEMCEGTDMVYRAATGVTAAHLGRRLPVESSLSGRCLLTNEMLVCEDSEIDERVDRDACRRIGIRSMVVVPLRVDDATLGVLKLAAHAPKAFDSVDLDVLELMAGFLALSLRNAQRFEANALHDRLTGVANGSLLLDRIDQVQARHDRHRNPVSVLFVDLDGFERVNDEYGHATGDRLLAAVAAAITRSVRATDTVARVGGDEFAVLCEDLGAPDAVDLVERLHEALAMVEVAVPGGGVYPRASIGVATSAAEGRTRIGELLAAADEAMYNAKRARHDVAPTRRPGFDPVTSSRLVV